MKSGKKILSLALAFIMVFSMLPGTLIASAASGTIYVETGRITSPGRTVRVMLKGNAALPAGGVDGASLNINYDPSALSVKSISNIERFTGTFTNNIDNENGVASLAWGDDGAGATSIGGYNDLAWIDFVVNENAPLGEQTVTITDGVFKAKDGTTYSSSEFNLTEGKILVTSYTMIPWNTTRSSPFFWNWDFASHTSPHPSLTRFAAFARDGSENWEFLDMSDDLWSVLTATEWTSNDVLTFGVNNSSNVIPNAPLTDAGGVNAILTRAHDLLFQMSGVNISFWRARHDSFAPVCPNDSTCSLPNKTDKADGTHTHTNTGFAFNGDYSFALVVDAPSATGKYELGIKVTESADGGTKSVWFAPYVEGENDIAYYQTAENLVGTKQISGNATTYFGSVDVAEGTDKYVLVFKINGSTTDQYEKTVFHGFNLVPHEHTTSDTWEKIDDDYHGKTCSACGDVVATELHSWGEGVVTKEPSRTEEGTRLYTCSVCSATKEEVIPSTLPTVPEETTYAFGGPRAGTLLFNYNYQTGATRNKELFNGTYFQYAYYNVQPANWKFFDTFDEIWAVLKSTEYQSDDLVKNYIDSDLTNPVTLGITDTSATGTTQRYLKFTDAGIRALIPQWNTSATVDTSFLKMWHGRQNSATACALGENCPVNQTAGHTHAFKWNVARSGFAIAIEAPAAGDYDISAYYGNTEGYNGGVSVWFAEFDGNYDLEHYAVEENLVASGEKLPYTNTTGNTDKVFGTVEITDATKPYIVVWQSTTTATNDTYDYYNLYNIKLTPHTHVVVDEWVKVDDDNHAKLCACGEVIETAIHNWDEGVVTVDPTHTELGKMTRTCPDCSATKEEDVPKKAEHEFGGWTYADAATHTKTCPCGEVVSEAHNWGEGVVTKEPSATSSGLKVYTCSGCSATKEEVLSYDGEAVTVVYDLKSASDNQKHIWNWDFATHTSPLPNLSEFAWKPATREKRAVDNWEFFDVSDAMWDVLKAGTWESNGTFKFTTEGKTVNAARTASSAAASADGKTYFGQLATAQDTMYQFAKTYFIMWGSRADNNTCPDGESCTLIASPAASHTHSVTGSVVGPHDIAFALDAPGVKQFYELVMNTKEDAYNGTRSVWFAPYVAGQNDIAYYKTDANLVASGVAKGASNSATSFGTVEIAEGVDKYILVFQCDSNLANGYQKLYIDNFSLVPHEHSYTEITVLDNNEHAKKCACGDIVIEAHEWDEGVETSVATTEKSGVITYTCSVCPATKVETTPMLEADSYTYSLVNKSSSDSGKVVWNYDYATHSFPKFKLGEDYPAAWTSYNRSYTLHDNWEFFDMSDNAYKAFLETDLDSSNPDEIFINIDGKHLGDSIGAAETGEGRYLQYTGVGYRELLPQWSTSNKFWQARYTSATCPYGTACTLIDAPAESHTHSLTIAVPTFKIAYALDTPAKGYYDLELYGYKGENYGNNTFSVWFAPYVDGQNDLAYYATAENLVAENFSLPASKSYLNVGTVKVDRAAQSYIVVMQSKVAKTSTYTYFFVDEVRLTKNDKPMNEVVDGDAQIYVYTEGAPAGTQITASNGVVAGVPTTLARGTVVSLEAPLVEGYHFSHWATRGGYVISDRKACEIKVTTNTAIKAVYTQNDEDNNPVVNVYGGLGDYIGTIAVTDGVLDREELRGFEDAAAFRGWTFDRWIVSKNGEAADLFATESVAVTKPLAVVGHLAKDTTTYAVHGIVGNQTSQDSEHAFGENKVVSWTNSDFVGWAFDDKVVSFTTYYSFPVFKAGTLRQMRTSLNDKDVRSRGAAVAIFDDGEEETKAYAVYYTVTADVEFVEAGVIFSSTGAGTIDSYESKVSVADITNNQGQMAVPAEEGMVPRAYILYKDAEGNYKVIYDDLAE